MSKNLLFFLTAILMAQLVNSATLYCESFGPTGQCNMPNLTEVTQPNEAITVYGQPSTYVDLESNYLNFMDTFTLRYIPTKIFSIFPNLMSFNLMNNSLTYLVTDAFVNCGKMTSISLYSTNVKNIPAGFAQTCVNVTNFMMYYGSLETIDVDAFKGLSNLNMLYLSTNKIPCIPVNLFQHTPNLQMVSFMQNLITFIDPLTFKGLKSLMYIDLGYNLIKTLPALDLTGTGIWNGFYLNFYQNPIYAINPDFINFFTTRPSNVTDNVSFYGITCLSDPNFSSLSTTNDQSAGTSFQPCYSNWTASMSVIPACGQPATTTTTTTTTLAPVTLPPTNGTCQSDRICRYFLDQFNRYTCVIDGVDSVLTSISGSHLVTFDDLIVRRVIFTNSFLSRIPPVLFQKFPSLEYLTVSGCSISTINTKTFTTCGNLRFLDASYNDIVNINGASFKNCTKIEVVDLTGNQISYIDGQLFSNN